jgi:hypothetical protein
VLLAELEVPIVHDAVTGAVRVSDQAQVTVQEPSRPTLLHVRLLQEWLLESESPRTVVASGRVGADGTVRAQTGGLAARVLSPTVFQLDFPGFDPARERVVLGQPIARVGDAAPSTFEVISGADPGLAALLGSPPRQGVVVRVKHPNGTAVADGFMVRIEQFGAPA